MAEKLKKVFQEKGYSFYVDSPTNQQFVLLKNEQIAQLQGKVAFSFWEACGESHTVVRFATSWATREEDIDALAELI